MKARISLSLVLLLVLLSAIPGQAQGPESQIALSTPFTYQGMLRSGGNPVSGTCDFQFGLWDAASSGTQIGATWPQAGVPVTRGLFTALLDFGASPFQGPNRYLEIAVRCPAGSGAYTTLTPRQPLTPAPYALYANAAHWSNLLGVPAGFADNVDNDTTYTAGAGLTLTGTQFSVVFAGTGAATTVARSDHDHDARYWKLNGNSGTTPGVNYLGTSDNTILEIKVNNLRALRLEPNAISPNIVGGYPGNNMISGGVGGTVSGGGASGGTNRVTDSYGTVSGGTNNQAGNGNANTADANWATVDGGQNNTAGALYATVGGGASNTASNISAIVGGGQSNQATGYISTIAGGFENKATGEKSAVGGGDSNTASGHTSAVAGGYDNAATAQGASVGGGASNTAGHNFATVPGGQNNTASARYAFAAGRRAKADDPGAFVWADETDADFASTASNQFAVRASGGVWFTSALGDMFRMLPNSTAPNIIGGHQGNNITAGVAGATIGGGGISTGLNRVTDNHGTVGGGADNRAGNDSGATSDAAYATVGGGQANAANGMHSTVGGGWQNLASGFAATTGGGYLNKATEQTAVVAGGLSNIASGVSSTIGGGQENSATASRSTIGGGEDNTAGGTYSTVGGGNSNQTTNERTTVAGGASNIASGHTATIGGGAANTAGGSHATISGGQGNIASGHTATIGGGAANTAGGSRATISGGQGNIANNMYATVGGGSQNVNLGQYGTIGGGDSNDIGLFAIAATIGGGTLNDAGASYSTVSGGLRNYASHEYASVGGGWSNTASGMYATVAGGRENTAAGFTSFAAGRRATANNQGCFVWGDSNDADIVCSHNNRWMARASGGVYFYSNSAMTAGVYLAPGSSTWAPLPAAPSDRNLKENIQPVDGKDILRQLAQVPIAKWNYIVDESSRHIGPMAQDFYAAFGVGEDDTHISTVDADGVALAALQGAYQLIQEKDAQIAAQQAQIDDLAARLAALESLVAQLAAKGEGR